LTCVPPHDLSLIGLSLKTEFPEIRWLVDWRDLWSYDVYYFEQVPRIFRNRILSLERKVFANCDVIVTTNIKAKRIIEKLHEVSPERTMSINHCFYRPDFDGSTRTGNPWSSCKRDGLINIGFLGNLFKPPKVPGSRVVEAIESAIGSGVDVKLHIFGDTTELAKKAVIESLNNAVILHPWTTHKESLKKISKCDFLLLALSDFPNCDVIMHGKLPHYLLLEKPILAMVPEKSVVADIIRETNSGYVIPTEAGWSAALAKILRDYSTEGKVPKRNEAAIEKYSWDNISRQWLEVISRVSLP
jgi:glycosyltransferase involved in cell wall biosynthesis